MARHVMTLRRDVVVLVAGRPFEDNLKIALANRTPLPAGRARHRSGGGLRAPQDIVAALGAGRVPKRMREIRARNRSTARRETRLEWLRRESSAAGCTSAMVSAPTAPSGHRGRWRICSKEFVGEILDEQDVGETRHPLGIRRPFQVDGRVTLDVAARELGIRVVAPRPRWTPSAAISGSAGPAPQPGETVDVPGFRLTDHRDPGPAGVRRLPGEPVEPAAEDDLAQLRRPALESGFTYNPAGRQARRRALAGAAAHVVRDTIADRDRSRRYHMR